MGLGRYHGQTKAIIALRQPPVAELLDSEQQELVYVLMRIQCGYI